MFAPSAEIVQVIHDDQYRQVRQLIEEYAALRNFDAALDGIYKELDQLPEYYPVILLAYQEGQPAGCVAFQQLTPEICEMKRLFVSPRHRSRRLGHELVRCLIEKAKMLGFRYMRLDTHPNMTAAHKLYESFGFTEIGRYNQNPIPGIRFFELQLSSGV